LDKVLIYSLCLHSRNKNETEEENNPEILYRDVSEDKAGRQQKPKFQALSDGKRGGNL